MDNKGMKKRVKRRSSMGDNDRISKLPDAVIIHILSFLPTQDVVRTCLLSKRWKLFWYSVPTIFFSKTNSDGVEKFYNCVDNYFEHRKKGMNLIEDSVVTSFKLYMNGGYQRSKAGLLDKSLAFAVESKVREINLSICEEKGCLFFYCLPKILDNARYLTILELNGVELDGSSFSFNFPSLKTLSLEEINQSDTAKDDVVFKFLLGCPSLEKLCLIDYEFLCINDQFRLQSSSLKFMELSLVDSSYELQVEAINLESLVLDDFFLEKLNISSCKKIRTLSLALCEANRPSLEVLISNIPLLENLTFSDCSPLLDHLKISCQHLKSLSFERMCRSCGLIHVTIVSAPRLEYFCYKGHIGCSISIESSNTLDGKIVIHDKKLNYDIKWFTNMMNFLVKLNCSWNIVTLHVHTYKALMWPENLKNICRYPLLNWKHLKVITDCKPERESELKDALLWISPSLETLSINEKVIF
ncbi:F-box/LRR-repeat protein At3g26922-like [Humulus lupulus]|uniref:F-box/LRR-repeat protein At3g26922-like n=1 Tax=Humulus lupulus TaxID=3486 RepID=UPI002B4073A9|nr:F-box/LRR-repeat protein At3g26922-like [Humulus lupulus]